MICRYGMLFQLYPLPNPIPITHNLSLNLMVLVVNMHICKQRRLSDACEAGIHGLSVLSQALYHLNHCDPSVTYVTYQKSLK